MLEQAVELTPDGNSDKPVWFASLGNMLLRRFQEIGDDSDLNKSIQVKERAANLTYEPANKSACLDNLGSSLAHRFMQLGDLSDLNRSIQALTQAMDLIPHQDSSKPSGLSNLGNVLADQFERLWDISSLNRSIEVFEQAIKLTPDGHSNKASYFNNLGVSLLRRFNQLHDLSDLNSCIHILEKAVMLTSDDHLGKASMLTNLGNSLLTRFEKLQDPVDLDRSIQVSQEAVTLTPEGHPDKLARFVQLGNTLICQFKNSNDYQATQAALGHYSSAAKHITGPLRLKFTAAISWMTYAQYYAFDQSMESCQTTMALIPQLIPLGASITDWHYQIMSAGSAARDAAAVAISAQQYDIALEWLEQGRSVAWNAILQLRSPINELKQAHPELAAKFQFLSFQLEQSTTGFTSDEDQSIPVSVDYHALAHERNILLQEIRLHKGFEQFLLQKTVAELIPAADGGPIIVLNLSKERVDALILHSDRGVIHLPLSLNELLWDIVKGKTANVSNRYTVLDPLNLLEQEEEDFIGGRKYHMLSEMWHTIVKPILDILEITTPMVPDQPVHHIWWCPRGHLSFLDLHAAGIYPDGPKLSDFAVSSYTPTISSLLEAKATKLAAPSQLLTVSLPIEAGLPATREEVQCIANHAQNHISVLQLCEEAATPQSVLNGLRESQWAHFSCHGRQDLADPTSSCLLLAKRSNLKLSDIINLRLKNAQLAFLSACETATGDMKLQDEAVHLAAGMLLAGYRGVIATMRPVDDEYAADIADETYRYLFEDYGADFTRAAEALHFAVRKVRKERESRGDFSLAWVPFIHMGV